MAAKETLHMRITEADKALWTEQATREGKALSELIREVMQGYVRRQVTPVGQWSEHV